ncbi:hypothetical protein [Nocardia sp. NPDC058480]|uniref:hypothetical protein n=1 Tax=Nocardia sp. NPDC058480 TaxID=3346522 RepID=UPI003650E2B3
MSDQMIIWLKGVDGSRWDLSGPDAGLQGIELRPGPKRIIEAPAKTFWLQGADRQFYQGKQFERRDPVFAVNIFPPANSSDPLVWRDVDSRFRMALGMYDEEFRLTVETGGDVRYLDMRLLSDPVPYENGQWEGKDPHLYAASTLTINAAASQPFWYASDLEFSWSLPSGTSGSTTFPFENRGDVIVWPEYFVTAPGKWTLPDRSRGLEAAYQRPAGSDLNRNETLPLLFSGEDCHVNSDPDEEFLVAANNAPVWARTNGRGLLYPIAPKTLPENLPVSVTDANPGAAVTLTIPRRYSRPFGVKI